MHTTPEAKASRPAKCRGHHGLGQVGHCALCGEPRDTVSRPTAALRIAAALASDPEYADTEPKALATALERLWTPTMWRVLAEDAGVPTPDTATQALVVHLLRQANGAPAEATTPLAGAA